jgi:hypothetical protein
MYKEINMGNEWINILERKPKEDSTLYNNNNAHIHCWCAIKYSFGSSYFVEHLAWNPSLSCWDAAEEDNISNLDSKVEFWQLANKPLPPKENIDY